MRNHPLHLDFNHEAVSLILGGNVCYFSLIAYLLFPLLQNKRLCLSDFSDARYGHEFNSDQ